MSLRSLFSDDDSFVKKRFLGFLIWHSLQSTAVLSLLKPLLLSPFSPDSTPLFPLSFLLSFLLFHFSLLLFSFAVFLTSSPQLLPAASPLDLLVGFLRLLLVSASPGQCFLSFDFRSRSRVSLSFVLFVVASSLSGSLLMVSICWGCQPSLVRASTGVVGYRGLVVGLLYGLHYIYKRRWVLEFPIIQRPPFFRYKMGLPDALTQAVKLSCAGNLFSVILAFLLPKEQKVKLTLGKLIAEHLIFYLASFVLILCWELCHHLYQVLHTKRYVFAPSKGSAAAETNPTEPLLAALEGSAPKSLLHYLAYLDLLMVSENNVDTWRRAAFFEETGDTYKRVIAVCLRPLEQFTLKLGEGLESCSAANPIVSHQLRSPTDGLPDGRFAEAFYDLQPWETNQLFYDTRHYFSFTESRQNAIMFTERECNEGCCVIQLCAWCARVVASLTARSHKEDRFGVAQLSDSNASVVSTLISCLLAVEILMGKKTNLESSSYFMGPASIKWATMNSGKRVSAAGGLGRRRGSPLYSKAYSMADVLRNSIYCIVSEFYDEMVRSAKAGVLDKDWIINGKPLYGTRELLLQKLPQFLDFRAC